MRSQLLRSAARCLWARQVVSPARRHLNCGSLPLEELFARGGPLRTFLERQAGSEAQLQVRGSELLAAAKLLSEKERELQETEHLLDGEGRAQGNGIQSRFLTLRLLFPTMPLVRCSHLPELEVLYSVATLFGLNQRSRHRCVHSHPIFSCLSPYSPLTQCSAPFYRI